MDEISFSDGEIERYGEQLRFITDRYITPISKILDHENGEHWGSGSYFLNNGTKYIITNEHVARGRRTHSLTHTFSATDNIYRIQNDFHSWVYPVDVAIAEIEEAIWSSVEHNSRCIQQSQFANRHAPVPSEYLFLSGFSAETSKFYFGTLSNPVTPFLTQEICLPTNDDRFDQSYHFALQFNPSTAVSTEKMRGLPNPHGMSGSLVWDTKIIYCKTYGIPWHCDLPVVTGIVWGWPSSDLCLIATKIEHFEINGLIKNINDNKTPINSNSES